MTDIAVLRTFMSIVETGSLVRAAERLNVTQSTVTARLKGLEDALGQTLFIRSKRGATLTDAGHQVRKYAVTILNLWRQAGEEVGHKKAQTPLTMAVSRAFADGLGPDLVDQVQRHFDCRVTCRVGHDSDLDHWLGMGIVDACLGGQAVQGASIASVPWRRQRLVLVGSEPARSTNGDPLYIYVDYGTQFGLEHAAAYSHAGTARLRFDTANQAVVHMLSAQGSAYIPQSLAALYQGRLFLLGDTPSFEMESHWSCRTQGAFGRWRPDDPSQPSDGLTSMGSNDNGTATHFE